MPGAAVAESAGGQMEAADLQAGGSGAVAL